MSKFLGSQLDMRGAKVTNLGEATTTTDAVTLGQLQGAMAGAAWKPSVRAASVNNVSLANPGASIDGVALNPGDRVLLKNQTDGTANGIYVWSGANSTLTRAADADTAAELRSATVLIAEGTTNADKAWTQTADNITLGTTNVVWAPFGAGMTYVGGNGVDVTGTTIAVKVPNNSGLIVDSSGVRVDPSVVTRKFAANIGNGAATQIDVVHNLSSSDVTWSLRVAGTGEVVDTDALVVDANTLRLTFNTAPGNNELRVVVHA